MRSLAGIILASCCLIAGCASGPELNPSSEFAPIQPIPKAEELRITGGIFDNGITELAILRLVIWLR